MKSRITATLYANSRGNSYHDLEYGRGNHGEGISMSAEGLRGLVIGALFIGLIITLLACWWYGRRLIRTEKTDAVFGNPVKALGGWHWVVSGVSTILLLWLYFSWDAARAFFPRAANELCQIAKVETAINPMRSVFPFESRVLKGTAILDRENRQIDALANTLTSSDFTDADRAELAPYIDRARALLASQTSPDSISEETLQGMSDIARRIDEQTAILAAGELPEGADTAILEALESQPGWGATNQEIPIKPTSKRGAIFRHGGKTHCRYFV